MAISLSAVLILGIILVVLVRGGSLRIGSAVIATLFGFFLASTGAAPAIRQIVQAFTDIVGRL